MTWEFGSSSVFYLDSTSPTSLSYSYTLDVHGTLQTVVGHHNELVTGCARRSIRS